MDAGSSRRPGTTGSPTRTSCTRSRVPLRVVDLDEDTTLYIGAALNGTLLEVVVADLETEDPRIVHAMALREKFHRYL